LLLMAHYSARGDRVRAGQVARRLLLDGYREMPESMALEFLYSQRNDGQYLSKTPKERRFPIAKDPYGREMLTASGGYYDENKDLDTVMRVGRVVYHLKADRCSAHFAGRQHGVSAGSAEPMDERRPGQAPISEPICGV